MIALEDDVKLFAVTLAFGFVDDVVVASADFVDFYGDGGVFGTSSLEVAEFGAADAVGLWRSCNFFGDEKGQFWVIFLQVKLVNSEEAVRIMHFCFNVNDSPLIVSTAFLIWGITTFNVSWDYSFGESWITMINRESLKHLQNIS